MKKMKNAAAVLVLSFLCLLALAWIVSGEEKPDQKPAQRGEYLVNSGGCHDCHTPLKMGPNGPEPDMAHMLAGHPQELVMPPAPALPPGPWMGSFAATMTAWAGPWGISFTANLTPDKKTGLGDWTEQNFIDTILSGRRMGKGRLILPPMPIPAMKNLNNEDLKAMFAYLQTIPAAVNRVPEPKSPEAPPSQTH